MASEGDKGNGGGGPQDQGIKVGDKVYTPEEAAGLIQRSQESLEKLKKVEPVLETIGKYGIDPEVYLEQAEGALEVVGNLISKGIIDQSGNLVKKREGEPGPKGDDDPLKGKGEGEGGKSGEGSLEIDKVAQVVAKAIGVDKIVERLKTIDETQNRMLEMDLKNRIKGKHPELSDRDLDDVLAAAYRDKRKSVWQIAEDMAKGKEEEISQYEKKFAEKYGLNLEELDKNKLKEQEAEGGAAALFQGKKFSFRGGKDTVSPREATLEFFRRQAREE